jgi:hypothetical protein
VRISSFFGPIGAAASLVLLAGCGAPGGMTVARCGPEQAAFDAAAKELPTQATPLESAAYAAAKNAQASDAAQQAARLNDDAGRLVAVIDRATDSYRSLRQCRAADERDLAEARQTLSVMQTCEATLRGAADALVAVSPASRARAARALSSPTAPPPAPYLALTTATIRDRPDAAGARIADLRKGTRANGARTKSVDGWTALQLNDGTIGYVETAALQALSLNASAAEIAAKAATARAGDADPVVVLTVIARQTVPDRVASFSLAVEAPAPRPVIPAATAHP